MAGRDTHRPAGVLQRFIIRFVDEGLPDADSAGLRQRLGEIAAEAGVSSLEWQRRLGVGADLVITAEPLHAAAADRLLRAANARADVVYAEADTMAGALPATRKPSG